MEGPEITFAEAVLDNGKFGKRTVRFETGRLAQQAQGSVAAYLDEETMLLSATSASKHPKDNFDFFPLTVDVEERSYAAGKIPGSFFRREGRPSTDAILVCRLIDRPLRPSFVDGLRNEVQIVITVLSIAPDEFYDALAINAASASTQISGLPFSGPIAGVRLALIDDQWVAFPKASQLENAVFDIVVAGRVVTDASGNDDVAIMMVEAEATENSWNRSRAAPPSPAKTSSRRAWRPPSRSSASSSRLRPSSPSSPSTRPRRSPTTRCSCRTRSRPTTPSLTRHTTNW
jgi:polyribonucleotide nucleotidyltransferase